MRLGSFKNLCLVANLVANLSGCATEPRVAVVENCIPDTRNNSFQCTDKEGNHQTKPWDMGMENYWCFPAAPMAEYLKGCK
jgi:hypothetical protein